MRDVGRLHRLYIVRIEEHINFWERGSFPASPHLDSPCAFCINCNLELRHITNCCIYDKARISLFLSCRILKYRIIITPGNIYAITLEIGNLVKQLIAVEGSNDQYRKKKLFNNFITSSNYFHILFLIYIKRKLYLLLRAREMQLTINNKIT